MEKALCWDGRHCAHSDQPCCVLIQICWQSHFQICSIPLCRPLILCRQINWEPQSSLFAFGSWRRLIVHERLACERSLFKWHESIVRYLEWPKHTALCVLSAAAVMNYFSNPLGEKWRALWCTGTSSSAVMIKQYLLNVLKPRHWGKN